MRRYMGNLMVISSKKDFAFEAPDGYVYRYIRLNSIAINFDKIYFLRLFSFHRYPNSFRATLAQVSSDMYKKQPFHTILS